MNRQEKLRKIYMEGRMVAEIALKSGLVQRGLPEADHNGREGEERQVFTFGFHERIRELLGEEKRIESLGLLQCRK